MKKKLLAVALLSAFAAPAFAADDSGVYLVGTAGTSSNITNVDTSTTLSGMIGYQFSSFFMVEGGMTMLADKANYLVAQTPVTIAGTTYTYTSTSLAGTDFAAVLGLPLTDDFSILLRVGYASFERTNNPSPPEVEVQWKGSTTGLAAQYIIPYDFSAGRGNKLRIGFRAGITKYNLTDATGLLKESPTNSYVGGVIQF
jgi:hypothetical protein